MPDRAIRLNHSPQATGSDAHFCWGQAAFAACQQLAGWNRRCPCRWQPVACRRVRHRSAPAQWLRRPAPWDAPSQLHHRHRYRTEQCRWHAPGAHRPVYGKTDRWRHAGHVTVPDRWRSGNCPASTTASSAKSRRHDSCRCASARSPAPPAFWLPVAAPRPHDFHAWATNAGSRRTPCRCRQAYSRKNAGKVCSPPADAPIPTTVNLSRLVTVTGSLSGTVFSDERFSMMPDA